MEKTEYRLEIEKELLRLMERASTEELQIVRDFARNIVADR